MKHPLKKMAKNLVYLPFCLLFACHGSEPTPGKTANDIDTTSQKHSTTATATAYKLDKDTGWGYKIFVNGKQFINQYQIPAISGIKTFASKEDAQKVGDWIVGQIKNGQPFGVSDSLLRKLEIKY
jgi:hypothetical protein